VQLVGNQLVIVLPAHHLPPEDIPELAGLQQSERFEIAALDIKDSSARSFPSGGLIAAILHIAASPEVHLVFVGKTESMVQPATDLSDFSG